MQKKKFRVVVKLSANLRSPYWLYREGTVAIVQSWQRAHLKVAIQQVILLGQLTCMKPWACMVKAGSLSVLQPMIAIFSMI